MWNNQKQKQKLFSLMSNLQTYYFKLDFQKLDQHTGGKWYNWLSLLIGLNILTTILPDMCYIPMAMTVVVGLHKFSLQATIDHYGTSM